MSRRYRWQYDEPSGSFLLYLDGTAIAVVDPLGAGWTVDRYERLPLSGRIRLGVRATLAEAKRLAIAETPF